MSRNPDTFALDQQTAQGLSERELHDYQSRITCPEQPLPFP